MEAGTGATCARCGAAVEGEVCPQCGHARRAPVWQPPAGAAPYGAPPRPPPTGPQQPPGELSAWWPRVGATILDNLLMLVAGVVLFLPVWLVTGDPESGAAAWLFAWLFLVLIGQGLIYAPLLMRREGKRNGQTLGKQAVGIRVIRADGRPMDYGTSALREWVIKTVVAQVAGAFSFGLAGVLDGLWPLWDGRNQSIHDKIASTLVLRA
jgi:uncharacterized RDD family membrane protein YckC